MGHAYGAPPHRHVLLGRQDVPPCSYILCLHCDIPCSHNFPIGLLRDTLCRPGFNFEFTLHRLASIRRAIRIMSIRKRHKVRETIPKPQEAPNAGNCESIRDRLLIKNRENRGSETS